jgi:hypothetical protein
MREAMTSFVTRWSRHERPDAHEKPGPLAPRFVPDASSEGQILLALRFDDSRGILRPFRLRRRSELQSAQG